MDNMEWRVTARIVGIVDQGLSIIDFLMFFLSCTKGVELIRVMNINREWIMAQTFTDDFQINNFVLGLCFAAMLYAAVVVLQLWMGLALFQVTDKSGTMYTALYNAEIWRNVSFLHLALGTIFHLTNSHILFMFAEGAIRIFMLLAVGHFMEELQTELRKAMVKAQITVEDNEKV